MNQKLYVKRVKAYQAVSSCSLLQAKGAVEANLDIEGAVQGEGGPVAQLESGERSILRDVVPHPPAGKWRDDVVAIVQAGDRGWVPSIRNNENAVYLASDVHQLLNTLAVLIGATENKLAALQTSHCGTAAQAIEALRSKLRDAPISLSTL